MQILSIASAFSQVWDGTSADTDWYIGHEADASYTIYTADELAGLSWLVKEGGVDFAGKTINIGDPGDDLVIDLGGNTWTPIGYWTSSSSIRPFRGSVNGNNCTIKNFRTSGSYRGLFGYVRSNTPADGDDIVIRDINIESNVSGTSYVGGICGYICGYSDGSSVYYRNAKIVNCTFNGNISASAANSYAGGIVGIAYYVTIDQCGTAGSVSGQAYVGGIAGYLRSGVSASAKRPILQNCVNSAEVKGLGIDVGGIVGYTYYANLQYNVNGGNVYGVGRYTGGIVGICANTTNIKYCLNSGSVNMGGAISGSGGSMTYCYYDTQRDTVKGIFNTADVSAKYKGLKTAQMTVTAVNTPPANISGDNWTTGYWSFQEGYYPIPKPMADSKFAKITSAPIFINSSENYANVANDVDLCSDALWESSNTAYIDNDGHIVTPSGSATLTATMYGLSKLFVVSNITIPNPIVITTEDQLKALRDAVNGVTDNYYGYTSVTGYTGFNFQLGNDIALTETWTPIGTDTHPFCGNFDGNGHKITNLNVSATSRQGFFGYVFNGTIKDLTVYGEIQGTSTYKGGICAYLKSDAVANWAKITNCHFIGNIVSTSSTTDIYAGGICGYATGYTKIEKCSAAGTVNSSTRKNNNFAGIVGYCYGSGSATNLATIINCVNLSDIVANSNSGGIVGRVYRYTDVANNMNAGNVSGKTENIGGIVGYSDNNNKVTIRYNVNAATVDMGSSIIGNHVATSYTVAPEHNYYDKQHSVLGGIHGADDATNDAAVGKSTTELCELTSVELPGFTLNANYYPVPTGFVNASVAIVAKAPVRLYGDETYNAVGHNDFTVVTDGGVLWTSDADIISISGSVASVGAGYGVANLTATYDGYPKIVKISVAEAGDGPLTIESYEDMQDFRVAVNSGSEGQYKGHRNVNGFSGVSFVVTNDISMIDPDGTPWVPVGTSTYPFSGNFDGGNHNITDLIVSRSSNYAGLFGNVTTVGRNSSTIENIKLSGDISNSKSYTGGIVGYATALSAAPFVIQNCHFNGTLIATTSSGSYVGGICGYIKTYCSIKDCTSAGEIRSASASNVGGICGYSAGNATTKNEISGCASIATNLRGVDVVGGIVGYVDNTDVKYNINAAIVNATNAVVGGIAGNVLAGASLTECFNFITTSSIGKIYGTNEGSVTDCYYDSQHCFLGNDNGTAKTTAQMKALSLDGANWSTNASRYPIPVNIESCSAAIVAASPVTLSGTQDNMHVTESFNLYTPTDLVWSSIDGDGFITIEDDGVNVTVNNSFSSVTLTATLGDFSKVVLLTNVDFVADLTIRNKTDLENFRKAVNDGPSGSFNSVRNVDGFSGMTFTLEPENGTDISILSTANWTPIGSTASTPFKGNFDGQGHSILGVQSTAGTGRGLFGYVENATIENLNVTSGNNKTIKATSYAGGIAGRAIKSTIRNCSFNGNILTTGSYAGGIVGRIEGSTIENCVAGGTVQSDNYGGGICGSMVKSGVGSRIENCASNMDILGNSSIGGITGYSSNSTVTNCINAGNVSGTTNNVGGIVGYVTDDEAVVSYCLNVGTAAGGAVVGFLNPGSTVSNNYYDNQWNVSINGIAEVGEEGDPSDEGTTSKTTQTIISDGAFASAWNAVSGRYPVPTAIKDLPATILASIPVKLGSQQYNLVTETFNVGTLTDLTWTSSNTSYVTISSGTANVLGTINDYASSILTATYKGWKKTVKVFRPINSDPLPIETVEDLKNFRNAVNAGATGSYLGVPNINGFVGKNFALTATGDIYDLNNETWTPIGSSSTCAFKGNFDGDGKTITGLKITSTSTYKGLFGYVNRGSIRNLNVVGNVSGSSYVGGICGYIKGGNGDNYSSISQCTFNGHVTATTTSATTYAGGIVGSNNSYTSITKCCVAGVISASATTNTYVGGITGLSSGASADKDSIASCTNAAVVNGSGDYVGGIAGGIKNTYIDYCNNGGNVSGVRHYTGGITGSNPSGAAVRYSMSSSLVSPGGAIIGINGGTATANFYDKQRTSVMGIAASDGTSADQSGKAVGLLTTEMTGDSPSGLTGDGWIPARWTYAENLYPIPTALGSNDFSVITATPIFIDKASATPANWNNLKPVNTLELGGPAGIVWTSDNVGYVNVSVDPVVISHPEEYNSATLTSTRNGVSKKYTLEDYGDLSSLDIYNLADLKEFRDAVNDREGGSYKGVLNIGGYAGFTINLLANITIDEDNWTPIGKAADCCFSGTFEGNDNTISNLKISNQQYAGLFGYIKYGSVLELNLANVTISNNMSYTGAVCGYIEGKATSDKSAISSCKVLSGTIKSTTSSSYLGGIAGAMGTNAYISACENSAAITSRSFTGGICGSVSAGSNGSIDVISECVNYGSITCNSSSYNKVGGIVGNILMAGNVVDCVNKGNVKAGYYVGGIAGYMYGSNDNSRKATMTLCINDATVDAISTSNASYAGGIVGYLGTFAKVDKGLNSGNVTGKKNYVGGVVGRSDATLPTKKNYILYSTNSADVTGSENYVAGICGRDTITEIKYCNNGGNVNGTTSSNIGGISGKSCENSIVAYNISTGTVEPSDSTNGICGTIGGTVENNYYDKQRSLCAVDNTDGLITDLMSGTGRSAFSDGDWSSNFVFNDNMYPMPLGTDAYPEAKLAATPVYLHADDASTYEVYDSVSSNITLVDAYTSWTTNDVDHISISGTTATITYPCDLFANDTLVASLYVDESLTLKKNVKVNLAYVKTPELESISDVNICPNTAQTISVVVTNDVSDCVYAWTPNVTDESSVEVSLLKSQEYHVVVSNSANTSCSSEVVANVNVYTPEVEPVEDTYIWYGRTINDWNTASNWMLYDSGEDSYSMAGDVPESSNNVIITRFGTEGCVVTPELNDDATINNFNAGSNVELDIASLNHLTINGNATINGAVIGNVVFGADATCAEVSTGYIDGIITKTGASDNFRFLTGHFDSDRSLLLRSALGMTVAGDDAEVSVHYTTNHDTYPMPDSYSHGGNMGGDLDHVSDRDFWHVRTNKPLSNVSLHWRNRESISLSDDCVLDFMRVAYVTGGSSVWSEMSGSIDGDCTTGSITIASLGGSRAAEQEYELTLGSTDSGDKLVLPIELVSFTASCNGNSVDVKWTTASEKNNDYFILERSYDAVNFSEVTRIAGAGNSIEENNYAYTDYEYYGGSMYYRLKQVDYDGKRIVSETIVVKCTDYELDPVVSVFPNPFRSEITLSLTNFANKPATVEIFDIMGTLVMSKDIDATGNEYEAVLNLDNLSSATYTIRVSTADFVVNKRIVKQ